MAQVFIHPERRKKVRRKVDRSRSPKRRATSPETQERRRRAVTKRTSWFRTHLAQGATGLGLMPSESKHSARVNVNKLSLRYQTSSGRKGKQFSWAVYKNGRPVVSFGNYYDAVAYKNHVKNSLIHELGREGAKEARKWIIRKILKK